MKTIILLISLLLYSPAWAAIAVVQSVSAQSSGTVSSITTGNINTTAGNLLICDQAVYYISGSNANPSDNKGNGYIASVAEFNHSSDTFFKMAQSYKENAAGGATHNFTLTSDGADFLVLACKEVSAALTSGALDQTAFADSQTGVSTGISSGSTAATSQANELVAGAGTTIQSDTTTYTPQSGFTADQNLSQVESISVGLISASKVVAAMGVQEFTFDASQTVGAALGLVSTWKAAAAAGAVIIRRGPVTW